MITDTAICLIADQAIETYLTIRVLDTNAPPVITKASQVRDQLTELVFSIHQLGATLHALGGLPLAARVIAEVEARLDDVEAAVFFNRRWDGNPRPRSAPPTVSRSSLTCWRPSCSSSR